MVNYDLGKVKAAAQGSNIEYRGRKVSRDIANLGYTLEDVANCLCQLAPSDFRKSHTYQNQPPDDEYRCTYFPSSDAETADDLYIKFCVVDDVLIIDLASFHLTQY